MILPDANVLIYAHNENSEHHKVAKQWLVNALQGEENILFCWQTVSAFIRIMTNSRAFAVPLPLNDAFDVVGQWMESDAAAIVEPGLNFLDLLKKTSTDGQASGTLFSDAFLAALALENGATLVTTDRDFLRFQGLKLKLLI